MCVLFREPRKLWCSFWFSCKTKTKGSVLKRYPQKRHPACKILTRIPDTTVNLRCQPGRQGRNAFVQITLDTFGWFLKGHQKGPPVRGSLIYMRQTAVHSWYAASYGQSMMHVPCGDIKAHREAPVNVGMNLHLYPSK